MIDPKIIAVENPTLAEQEAIFGPLLAYNESNIGDPKFVPFAIQIPMQSSAGYGRTLFMPGYVSSCCSCLTPCVGAVSGRRACDQLWRFAVSIPSGVSILGGWQQGADVSDVGPNFGYPSAGVILGSTGGSAILTSDGTIGALSDRAVFVIRRSSTTA